MHKNEVGGNIARAASEEQFSQINAAARNRRIPVGTDRNACKENAKDLNGSIRRGKYTRSPQYPSVAPSGEDSP